jgi:hypothetical protein
MARIVAAVVFAVQLWCCWWFSSQHLLILAGHGPRGDQPASLGFVLAFFSTMLCSLFVLMRPGPYALYAIGLTNRTETAERHRRAAATVGASRWTWLRWYLLGGTVPRTPRWGTVVDALPRLAAGYSLAFALFGVLVAPGTPAQREDFWELGSWNAAFATLAFTLVLFVAHNWFGWWGQRAHWEALQAWCPCGQIMEQRILPMQTGQTNDTQVTFRNLRCWVCPRGHTVLYPDDTFLDDVWKVLDSPDGILAGSARGQDGPVCRQCREPLKKPAAARLEWTRTLTWERIPPFQLTVTAPGGRCPACGAYQIATVPALISLAESLSAAFPMELPRPPDPQGACVMAILAAQPDPPRQIAWGAALRVALHAAGVQVACCISGLLAPIGFLFAWEALLNPGTQPPENGLAMWGLTGLGLLPLLVPVGIARRLRQVVATGVQAEAEVLEGDSSLPGDQSTVGAVAYGRAEGRRRVAYPAGPVEESYTVERPWGPYLEPGSRMVVLVDSDEHRVLLDVSLVLEATTAAAQIA